MTDKARENRLRRLAKKQGLLLKKSRVSKSHVDDWGGWMIIDYHQGNIVSGEKFNLSLDDVERFLKEE